MTTLTWFERTKTILNTLAEELELDPIATEKLKETVYALLAEEYKAGCHAGTKYGMGRIEKINQALKTP